MATTRFSTMQVASEPQIAADLSLDDLTLDWVTLSKDLDVRGALTDATLERTIEGASTLTLTLEDPRGHVTRSLRLWVPQRDTAKATRRWLQQTRVYDRAGKVARGPTAIGLAVEAQVDGITFRCVKASRQGTQLSLVFEDRAISWLRGKTGVRRSASRSDTTRAQFLLALLREIKVERIPFVCPQLSVRQALGGASTSTTVAGTLGAASLAGMDGNGQRYPITGGARSNLERVMRQADADGATGRARLALIEACNIEAQWRNPAVATDHDSLGILQARVSYVGRKNALDIEWCVHKFLVGPAFTGGAAGAIALAKKNPGWTPGQIAQTIQGSGYADRYERTRTASERLMEQWAGASNSSEAKAAAAATGTAATYRFERAVDEDSWTAMQRLAQEVGWRLFMRGRSLVFMSEPDLFRQPVRMTLALDDPGVLDLQYDVDWGKTASTVTASVVMRRWDAPPGTCIEIDDDGSLLDGRWLVSSVSRSLFDPVASVTLTQPARALLEPQGESAGTSTTADPNETLTGAKGKARKAFDRAKAISDKNMPYVWGGGHARPGSPSGSPAGYDCSGYVGACLLAAGLSYAGQASGGFGSLSGMTAGRGKYLTIYYSATHVWMRFETALGVTSWRADTSPYNSGARGPHVRTGERPTSGFTACHPTGL